MNPADPRLTAYADGALPPNDSLRLEHELAADPAARAELDDILAMQRSLREAFAGGPSVEWRRLPMRVAPRLRRFRFRNLVVPLLALGCAGLVAFAFLFSEFGAARESVLRSVDAADVRQIGLACRVFSEAHGDRLPVASDIRDFARQLAVGGGLTDASVWVVESEAGESGRAVSRVLAADEKSLAPDFAGLRLSFAVLLSGLEPGAPRSTPVAWTRGLRADGTWAPDSPYGGDGGHVVFLDGTVTFFRRIEGGLARYDGRGETSDIREALPPGARVGEAL